MESNSKVSTAHNLFETSGYTRIFFNPNTFSIHHFFLRNKYFGEINQNLKKKIFNRNKL